MNAVLERPAAADIPLAGALFAGRDACCACRVLLFPAESEPVPSRPWLRRCRDEDGCRERFRPRALAWSVRRA